MQATIRILHLEDSLVDRELVRELLEDGGLNCQITAVSSQPEFSGCLQDGTWDVILADFSLPNFDGATALNMAQRNCPNTPFIFLSGVMGEDVAVESLKSGATDYVLKQRIKRLCPAIRRALKEVAISSELDLSRAQALAESRRSETFFRDLLEAVPNAIVVINAQDQITLVNGQAEKLFGYSRKELIGQSIEMLLPESRKDGQQQTRPTLLVVTPQQVTANEPDFCGRRQDGSEFPAEISIGPLVTRDGILVACTIVDITERRRFEQTLQSKNMQLEKANKLQDEFLSHVSHELRSPLTVVHQFVSILLDGLAGQLNANQMEYLEIAFRNANQLKAMIDDLLEASRADTCKLTVKLTVVSTAEVVRQTLRSFAATAGVHGITLETHIPDNLPPVYADPARIGQVLTNLLDNAVKFSPAKSTITVRVQVLKEEPQFVRVSVADCGSGVDPEDSQRIFERLYQAKNSLQAGRHGLGLGLYICKELMGLQGGRIWNDPERRGGCSISFTLPVYSMEVLLAPIVKNGDLNDSSFALLTIEVLAGKAWLSDHKREQAMFRAYQVIGRCILPDLDVLLPHQNRLERDLFHIVARTDKLGADAIAKRVRDQIALCEELKQAKISCTISSQLLDLSALEKGWPLEKQVEYFASRIEEMLQAETTERMSVPL